MAADRLECAPEDIELTEGRARVVGVPESGIAIRRLAAASHWHPLGMPDDRQPGIRETFTYSPPVLKEPDEYDRVPSSVTYGSVFDLAAVEIDPKTGRIDIHTYASVHDVGNMLNPLIVKGQIYGGFAHGLGAALLEELRYGRNRPKLIGYLRGLPLPHRNRDATPNPRPYQYAVPQERPGFERARRREFHADPRGHRQRGERCPWYSVRCVTVNVGTSLAIRAIPIGGGQAVKPARFDYYRAASTEEAVSWLHELGDDAAVLAGGMSLGPMLNMRVARPEAVIDINAIAPLHGYTVEKGRVACGALLRQAMALKANDMMAAVPLLAEALPHVGHFQTRNQGTLGGSAAHADPSAEIPLVLVALGGEVHLQSQQGRRVVPAQGFFLDILTTAREPEELVIGLSFPTAVPRRGYAFEEISARRGDFAIVAVAASVDTDEEGGIIGARLAFGGVEERPRALQWAENIAPEHHDEWCQNLAMEAAQSLSALPDPSAGVAYRLSLAQHLAERALITAHGRAIGKV